ncbi:trypsin-like peptidase domain-containing protein [Geodermatophilus sp. DSM 44513]|uniref:S1C family serine protease n=1 Tax=Geodermatophilus sp. DSM 44513 TaxID=1528104 RepID=UPI00126C52C3|nr:trypsin-like peptidase domain-containing protein [Geodermatophilus sp. DSM 44513]WNV77675.1 trypsin-like peptidase domain-containing protein [Geodermatophilus sp. DSM 44513]
MGVAGLLAGAFIGAGTGAGAAVLLDDASGAATGASSTQSVVVEDPETATAVSTAAATASPSVVTVYVTTSAGAGSGSGVVLTEDGYVLTNDHVVAAGGGGPADVQVRTADGTLYEATVVGTEPSVDLAVLRLSGAGDLTPATFANSAQVRVGDLAVAIGAPLGLSDTVTNGIVSALHRPVTAGGGGGEATVIDALQTDAAINPGNSGGALVDAAGEVIGINTAIATVPAGPGGQASGGNIGVGFAIPSNTAQRIAGEIIADGSASTALLGVNVQTAAADGNPTIGTGAEIVQVQPGSSGADAGLQAGDVVTAIGDRPVTTSTELTAAVRGTAPGSEVTLDVERGDTTNEVEVTLGGTTT